MSYDDDIDLGSYDQTFAQTEVDESGLDDVDADDGEYEARLDVINLKRAKTGTIMLSWKWRVLKVLGANPDETQIGRVVWKNSFVSDAGMAFLKKDLAVCGLKLGTKVFAKLSDLKTAKDKLLGVVAKIKKTTNGDFKNVYINKRVADAPALAAQPELMEAAPGVTPEAKAKVPF